MLPGLSLPPPHPSLPVVPRGVNRSDRQRVFIFIFVLSWRALHQLFSTTHNNCGGRGRRRQPITRQRRQETSPTSSVAINMAAPPRHPPLFPPVLPSPLSFSSSPPYTTKKGSQSCKLGISPWNPSFVQSGLPLRRHLPPPGPLSIFLCVTHSSLLLLLRSLPHPHSHPHPLFSRYSDSRPHPPLHPLPPSPLFAHFVTLFKSSIPIEQQTYKDP